MKKTKCVFEYDFINEVVLDKYNPDCKWILEKDAIATLKIDGSACLYKNGILFKRYDRKLKNKYLHTFAPGENVSIDCFKEPPEGFEPCEESFDPNTYHWPGWVPVGKHDKYHLEAFENSKNDLIEGATYELMGPKVAKNTGNLDRHLLLKHGAVVLDIPDRSYEGLKKYLSENYIEGIVFHNKKDGRLAKITRSHYGLFWKEEDYRKNKHKK